MKYFYTTIPKDILINYFEYVSPHFPHQVGVVFSEQFCIFFNKNFEDIFFKETGLRLNSKISMTRPNRDNSPLLYQPGLVSKLNLVLWIMPEYFHDISFCWKSKTGKLITPTDDVFDETDLECWLEGLKPNEYWQQVATEKKSHPFQIANLSFDLKVFEFGVDMELRIYNENNDEKIISNISNSIEAFNEFSEALNRKNGVVHNYKFIKQSNYLCLRIDTGSAGVEIIKRILKLLAKMEGIIKVEVDV